MVVTEFRKKLGLSREEFAKKFFVPPGLVKAWEVDAIDCPLHTIRMMERIVELEEKVRDKDDLISSMLEYEGR